MEATSQVRKPPTEVRLALTFSVAMIPLGYITVGSLVAVTWSGIVTGFVLWLVRPLCSSFRTVKWPYILSLGAYAIHWTEEEIAASVCWLRYEALPPSRMAKDRGGSENATSLLLAPASRVMVRRRPGFTQRAAVEITATANPRGAPQPCLRRSTIETVPASLALVLAHPNSAQEQRVAQTIGGCP